MNTLDSIRKGARGILVAGNHPGIVQSILDFDYLCGKPRSILAIVTGARKAQKYFWGSEEFLLPCVPDYASVPEELKAQVRFLVNVQSGRRAYESTVGFCEAFPDALGVDIFAENVPEAHATALIERYSASKIFSGPSGVGILVPGYLKIGAVGGIDAAQISQNSLATMGSVAVVSTSGGMTNELINAVITAGHRVSFALSIGGDRFPISSLGEVLALAQADEATHAIAYFGELGGVDEYEIVELIKSGKLTKPVVAYVAGVVDESFAEHVQFGHAKALVAHEDESARAKREALRTVGAAAPDTFPEFLNALRALPPVAYKDPALDIQQLLGRRASILSTRQVVDTQATPAWVKEGKLVGGNETFATTAVSALIGRPLTSPVSKAFFEAVGTLLIDHGGNVSGAVNTMITARAGKDLVSSLAAGLLTVGPRFGGAINEAARLWLAGVAGGETAGAFVERITKSGSLILGIGHLKYRVGMPDPRVAALAGFAELLSARPHYDFAREVEAVTTTKSGSLILNVDGIMAALALDILAECEGFTSAELRQLTEAEFFNALFVIPRTVGFIAHFMEQKENDEGLFRLPDSLLFVRPSDEPV